ncbi:MAG TPA: DUF1015 domain-containing protein [Candidatus Binataceae bacterium]|nr:DUF1015 domain-containing protein [Candidatus Binataceae bacterium]
MSLTHRIEPFAALAFDPTQVGSWDQVVAPPYDLIDAARQNELYARSPYNVIRLELNREADPYAAAAATLAEWRASGVVTRASRPAIYLYAQRFAHDGRKLERRGLIARVRLEAFGSGRILPHERTFPKAKEDRLKLLEATRTNISSIFALYSSDNAALEKLLSEIARREITIAATDEAGIVNEIRAITTPEEIAIVQHALADAQMLIADGHHRYETALEYRRRRIEAGSEKSAQPFDYVMMTLVAFDDPGLVILPTHRVVRQLPADASMRFAARSGDHFAIEEFADPGTFRAALTSLGRGALGVALKGDPQFKILTLRDSTILAHTMPAAPPAVRELEVSILHALVFDRIFGITAEEVRAGGSLEYTIDAHAALAKVATGAADGAFLMNPPMVDDVARVAAAGATMPEKSTYFFPKLLTGLVMNPLDA